MARVTGHDPTRRFVNSTPRNSVSPSAPQAAARYYAYHAVPLNGRRLEAFREQVKWLWLRVLRRRSQRHRMTWERIVRLASRWLPHPRILHPWPDARFAVKHPR